MVIIYIFADNMQADFDSSLICKPPIDRAWGDVDRSSFRVFEGHHMTQDSALLKSFRACDNLGWGSENRGVFLQNSEAIIPK